MTINIDKIKQKFSIFNDNPDLIYLDSAATSLTPDIVVDEMSNYYKKYRSSINRGSHKLGQKAGFAYNEARNKIAQYFNVNIEEIIFTKSTTNSINQIARALSSNLKSNDEIIVTNLEHHSNFLPWLELSKKLGCKLKIIEAQNNQIDIQDVINKINNKTKLIAIHHISNVIGDEVNIKELCDYTKNKNILTLIDGAQAAAHQKINLKEINCDFYTISAHKMFGPTGLGILYINQQIQKEILPFDLGGDMVEPSSVDVDTYTTKKNYMKFEAGTPSIAEVIGMGKAIDFINEIGINNIDEYTKQLKYYAIDQFEKISDIAILYNKNNSPLITFNIKGVAVHDAVSESIISNITFDSANIILRDGQHCNNLTMKYTLKEKSVLRASLSIYNTKEDIDKLINQIKKIHKQWN